LFKLEFHDTDTDILAKILADTSDTRDSPKLFPWQAERHADILATILASMSARMSVSVPWNASFIALYVKLCVQRDGRYEACDAGSSAGRW